MGGWYWFQWNQQKPERVALNRAPHFPAGDPPGGILNCRINPKLHPIHTALPTSLNSASGPGLPYFPTRQQSSPSLPPPPCSHPGTEALALPVPGTPSKIFKRHLFQVSPQKSRPEWPSHPTVTPAHLCFIF